MKRYPVCLAVLLAALAAPAIAAPAGDGVAQLYTYRLTDRAAFEKGYQKHLQWHADRNDALVWYAWYVTDGPRVGLFVDGTFGASLAQLDARPDLPGDGADFAVNAAPHATALGNDLWRLWREVSTATTLEDRRPSPVLDVFHIEVAPSRARQFEAALAALAAKRPTREGKLSWYRAMRGSDMTRYIAMLARENWADLDEIGERLPDILARAYARAPAEADAVMAEVTQARSETWSYRPALSLIPGQSRP